MDVYWWKPQWRSDSSPFSLATGIDSIWHSIDDSAAIGLARCVGLMGV